MLVAAWLLVMLTAAYAVNVIIQNHWAGGFQGQVDIPVTSELHGWRVHLTFDQDVSSIEVCNAAFAALVAAEDGIQTARYRSWGVEQINYILGDNHHDGGCFSFQIGFGTKYPRNPHHRAASCPDRPAPCSHEQLDAPGPSPQLLVGAIVGGPDAQDNYVDDRKDYVLNEVATDYNSGFHSALAAIVHLQVTDNFPQTNNRCACNQ